MEASEVFEKVKGLFIDDLGIDESKVTMDAKLEEDLEIDSLGIVEVVMALKMNLILKLMMKNLLMFQQLAKL